MVPKLKELSCWSTGPYVKSITTTQEFFFANISLALSSMQVSLAAASRYSGSADAF